MIVSTTKFKPLLSCWCSWSGLITATYSLSKHNHCDVMKIRLTKSRIDQDIIRTKSVMVNTWFWPQVNPRFSLDRFFESVWQQSMRVVDNWSCLLNILLFLKCVVYVLVTTTMSSPNRYEPFSTPRHTYLIVKLLQTKSMEGPNILVNTPRNAPQTIPSTEAQVTITRKNIA